VRERVLTIRAAGPRSWKTLSVSFSPSGIACSYLSLSF
jgi:hypothetical protein